MPIAWEITDDDIEIALDALGLDSSSAGIEDARDHIQCAAVERAALSSTDFDEQWELAQRELKEQLSIAYRVEQEPL